MKDVEKRIMKLMNLLSEQVLSVDAKEAEEKLRIELEFSDEMFKNISSNSFKVLVPRTERKEYIKKIKDIKDFEYDIDMKGSSLGGFKYGKARVLIKPIGAQGRKAPGMENEDNFVNGINKYASKEKPISVVLDDEIVIGIYKAIAVGTKIKEYKKTDVVLKRSNDERYNISLKKGNAEFWESSDTRYREVVKDLIDEIRSEKHPVIKFVKHPEKANIYKMYNKETGKLISGFVAAELEDDEAKDVTFGDNDEVNLIVVNTFAESDFNFDPSKNELNIKVKYILRNLEDIKKHDIWPVLKIRHDSTRDKTYGLRPVIYYKNKAFILALDDNKFVSKS